MTAIVLARMVTWTACRSGPGITVEGLDQHGVSRKITGLLFITCEDDGAITGEDRDGNLVHLGALAPAPQPASEAA